MAVLQNELAHLDPQSLWDAVMSRDASFDGRFVYAVRSTRVYCKPSCPSRRPRQSQALFFAVAGEARREGYRPCRRCRPDMPDEDAKLVQLACDYIDECIRDGNSIPSLVELTDAVGVGASRLVRVFRKETGISPAQYARGKRLGRFKAAVRNGSNISDAMYDAGFGSSSRLYEGAESQLGMTPASYRKGGVGAAIRYIVTESALGGLLVAGTPGGICAVKLGDDYDVLIAELRDEFPAAEIHRAEFTGHAPESSGLRDWTSAMLEYLDGSRLDIDLPLDVLATAFQWRVWRRLQAIPTGETRTYHQLAEELDKPTASRAVGRACATNPVAPIIPCHRAVRKDGGLAGYRWGLHRKEALLEMERKQSGRE